MTGAPEAVTTGPEQAPPGPASGGYWAGVWREFRRGRAGMLGLGLIALLFLLAAGAPVLASRFPFLWSRGGEWSSPWLREFLAPFETGERTLNVVFNYLLLSLPVALLVLWRTRRAPARRRRLRLAAAGLLLAVPFVLPHTPAGDALGIQPRLDATPYRSLAREGSARGVFPPLPVSPLETSFGHRLAPDWHRPGAATGEEAVHHLLGTDKSGRDVLARLIHGARVSLAVGVVAMSFAAAIGILLGSLAGYFGGRVDMLISRLIEIVMCFPTFFLILALLSIITTRSILIIMLLIGLTGWTGIARLVRGEVLRQRSLDYVAAAVALGAGSGRIIFRHVLPNAVAPVLVSITFGVAGAILTESGLAFLGLGVDPTSTASWGELLYQAREGPLLHWWLVLFPGFAIFFTVTTYNLVGEGLRDAMDPRLRENG
jgi:ABC-type dipeptide/oligopeptide/nickel transport system permease subunit